MTLNTGPSDVGNRVVEHQHELRGGDLEQRERRAAALSVAKYLLALEARGWPAWTPSPAQNQTFISDSQCECLRNGGQLEVAQQMANHESARTTRLYDERQDQVLLDEVEQRKATL
ncbi:hypothetical protein [Variovorax ginsengisoli]|uniref:Integrase n=1 Tax=Variovorax ginsengisoli TaxID=363844 RepID=A0ABT9S9R1_9BURK|nr:hypothetical protein [Variovorax ginsengisoli]MDP9901095.1 hypothetical protein [Variovorax ginsengisoli]